MKVNSKTTNAANLICHQGGQRTVNGIIGNTRRGIQVDQTLDPDSNNPVANKPVSTALAALAGELAKGQVVFLDQLPESGEPHKVYVLTATNQRYWWDGSAFVKIVPTASGSANIISNDMIHYTAEEGKVYDKLVFPNGDKYAQYFPLEGDVGTSYYYRAKRIDFSENEDEPDKISLSYIKFLLDGGKIKRSSVDADLPKYEAFEGVQTKANNSLQKPEIAPTKTKLVGIGASGQENIEIGDNLTLANGKLSATGSSGGGTEIKSTNIYLRYRQNRQDWKVGDSNYLDSESVQITPVNTKTVCYQPYYVSQVITPYGSNTATLLVIHESTSESSGYVNGRINVICLKAGSSNIDLSLTQKRLYTE